MEVVILTSFRAHIGKKCKNSANLHVLKQNLPKNGTKNRIPEMTNFGSKPPKNMIFDFFLKKNC